MRGVQRGAARLCERGELHAVGNELARKRGLARPAFRRWIAVRHELEDGAVSPLELLPCRAHDHAGDNGPRARDHWLRLALDLHQAQPARAGRCKARIVAHVRHVDPAPEQGFQERQRLVQHFEAAVDGDRYHGSQAATQSKSRATTAPRRSCAWNANCARSACDT
jgi:hypothetical protein